jgi:predicted dehydrogenase
MTASEEPNLNAGRPLKAAVVGTGFVGPHHVDAVRRGGYADVVAIVGSDPGRTQARALALGVERATTDLEEVLRDPLIDVVHVCTPNHTHVPLGTAVLQAGKHLVMEKPVAVDLAGARSLVALAARLQRHAVVTYTYRGYPMVQRARAAVAAGELGEIRLVHGTYLQDWLTDPTDYNWRLEPEAGGPSRAVADIGTHWFDTAEFISGRRIQSVVADLATFIPTRQKPVGGTTTFATGGGPSESVEITSEDAATILVRFEGGARGACVISQISPGRKNAFALEIAGSQSSLNWEQELPERLWLRTRAESRLLVRDRPDGRPETVGVPALPAGHPEGWDDALRDLLRAFYAAVASGKPPAANGAAEYPTLADGARGIAFVEAVLESARSRSWTAVAS